MPQLMAAGHPVHPMLIAFPIGGLTFTSVIDALYVATGKEDACEGGALLQKFAAMQMVDVHLPTTDGHCLVLPRYTQPEEDQSILLSQMKLELPKQPPPKITSKPPLPSNREISV